MIDTLLSKTPPQNIDAEESILSALFINNNGFEYTGELTPEDFYKGANRKIYASMLGLIKNKEPVDLVTVAQDLQKKDELESVGGAAYLSNISNNAPMAANVGAYSRLVMGLARSREMIKIASGIIENGFSVSDVEQYISDSQAKILSVQTSTSKDKFFDMETLMQEGLERIEKAQAAEFELGLKFGFPTLDNFMQNWGSKLILLAARPGMGKTSLALSIAVNLGYQGITSGILSIEMDKEQFADKMISAESRVNSMAFYAKDSLSSKSLVDIDIAAQSLATLPIYIDDSECNLEDVKRKGRKLKKLGAKILFIDQLNQIETEKGLKPFLGISKNCSEIKRLTKELRIPIVLLCQLNRELEKRNDKRPLMSDLAETGRLEQDADMILFLFREGYYKKYPKETGYVDPSVTEIELAKNRQGAKDIERQVLFNTRSGMFNLAV